MLTDRLTDPDRATAILRDLVAIESVNPAYPGGRRGEGEVARYFADYISRLGLVPKWQEVFPDRNNVWAFVEAPGATRTILFDAHMDTVTLEPVGQAMVEPSIREGRLFGRGACDDKGSLAAMIAMLPALLDRPDRLKANVIVLATVDEEYNFAGINAFIKRGPSIDAAVVGEPTDLKVVRAHKGALRWRLTTRGRNAHTSRPQEGVNAIYHMVPVIEALRTDLAARLLNRSHPLLGNPTCTVAMIEGGTGFNIVPDSCTIGIDRRVLPNETPEEVIAEIEEVLAAVRERHPEIDILVGTPDDKGTGLDTPADDPLVRLAETTVGAVLGNGEAIGVPYGTHASALSAAGVPSIVLGPGSISVAHSPDESVPLEEVGLAAELYARIAFAYGR
jgi:acetylornithine deacetylase/succinyl-diaminopimelate desuccinylase-like protein